jgi:hypothetical protein
MDDLEFKWAIVLWSIQTAGLYNTMPGGMGIEYLSE